jgi:hypothetical protein
LINQLLLYDQAVLTWLTDNLPSLLKGRSTQILVATARKMYAEATTGILSDNLTLTFPRIVVTRLDHIIDPLRFNSNKIRRLGWCTSPEQNKLRSANYPTPVNISYQVDMWTRFVKEMNLWEQKIFTTYASGYSQLSVTLDDVWSSKSYTNFLEGGINDTSELEPGEGERAIRKTFTFRSEAWLFDQDFVSTAVVKQIEMQFRDLDDDTLYDRQFLPPKETIATGNGILTSFGPIIVDRFPILEHTIILETQVGGSLVHVIDDGSGSLISESSDFTSGTVNYTTGSISLIFSSPPDDTEDITISYFMDQD